MDFSMNAVDLVIASTVDGNDFREFCENLDILRDMFEDTPYLEAVDDPGSKAKQTGGKIMNRTIQTTRGMATAYDGITTAGGTVIGGAFDIVMGCINLMVKVINYIVQKGAAVVDKIRHLGISIKNIPTALKAKIRGDVSLHITVDDIAMLYNQTLMQKLDTFIATGTELSRGEVWKEMFSLTNRKDNGGIINLSDNDMERCRRMDSIYQQLRLVKFNLTKINMSDQKNVDIYFGDTKSVSFTDLSGKKHNSTYYEALEQLLTDVTNRRDNLREIQKAIGGKYDKSRLNQSFSRISPAARQRVILTIQMMSRMIAIVGDIVKCVMIDIDTINKSNKKIMKKSEKNKQKVEDVLGNIEVKNAVGVNEINGKFLEEYAKKIPGANKIYLKYTAPINKGDRHTSIAVFFRDDQLIEGSGVQITSRKVGQKFLDVLKNKNGEWVLITL